MKRRYVLCLLAVGCGSETDPKSSGTFEDTGEARELELDTTPLPTAALHVPYTTELRFEGGALPVEFALSGGVLPEGLVLNPNGYITGVPIRSGTFNLAVTATDALGRQATRTPSLDVVATDALLICGGSTGGTFELGALDDYGYDLYWDRTGGYEVLQLHIPEDGVGRVELSLTADPGTALWVGYPGVPVDHRDSWDFEQHHVYDDTPVLLTEDSSPSLGDLAAVSGPVTLIVAADGPGDWSLDVACTDTPTLTELTTLPVALGDALIGNHNIVGDNMDLLWSADDRLPDWAVLDPTNGRVEGVAEQTGVFTYGLTVETPEGLTAEGEGTFSVYAPVAADCGETVTVYQEEGYYDGDLAWYDDPRGYNVLRTPVDNTISQVLWTVQGASGQAAAVAPASSTPFYGSVHRDYFSGGSAATVALDSGGEYSLAEFMASSDTVGLVVAGEVGDADYTVAVSCDTGPRLSKAALPVLKVGEPFELDLTTVGGTGPFSWSADGLPAGVSLSTDGRLSSDGTAEGDSEVTLHIEDSFGVVHSRTHTLHAGAEAACDGARRLQCGDVTELSVSASGVGLCVVFDHDDVGQVILQTSPASADAFGFLSLGYPGATRSEILNGESELLDWVEADRSTATVLRKGATPDLARWDGLVLRLELEAYSAFTTTASLSCE